MSNDPYNDREVPLTDEELTKEREAAVESYREVYEDPTAEPKFTCIGCHWERICGFRYDLYNTDGDCLASK